MDLILLLTIYGSHSGHISKVELSVPDWEVFGSSSINPVPYKEEVMHSHPETASGQSEGIEMSGLTSKMDAVNLNGEQIKANFGIIFNRFEPILLASVLDVDSIFAKFDLSPFDSDFAVDSSFWWRQSWTYICCPVLACFLLVLISC